MIKYDKALTVREYLYITTGFNADIGEKRTLNDTLKAISNFVIGHIERPVLYGTTVICFWPLSSTAYINQSDDVCLVKVVYSNELGKTDEALMWFTIPEDSYIHDVKKCKSTFDLDKDDPEFIMNTLQLIRECRKNDDYSVFENVIKCDESINNESTNPLVNEDDDIIPDEVWENSYETNEDVSEALKNITNDSNEIDHPKISEYSALDKIITNLNNMKRAYKSDLKILGHNAKCIHDEEIIRQINKLLYKVQNIDKAIKAMKRIKKS